MKKSNYFNDLSEEKGSRYIPLSIAKKRYCLSLNTLSKLAKESGAFLKIGRSARIDTEKLDTYLAEKFTVK